MWLFWILEITSQSRCVSVRLFGEHNNRNRGFPAIFLVVWRLARESALLTRILGAWNSGGPPASLLQTLLQVLGLFPPPSGQDKRKSNFYAPKGPVHAHHHSRFCQTERRVTKRPVQANHSVRWQNKFTCLKPPGTLWFYESV